MIHKKIPIIVLILSCFLTAISGCIEFTIDKSTTYQIRPTKINYSISYGYEIICTGTRTYEITYNCDLPDVLLGTTKIIDILYNEEYTNISVANNSVIRWNIISRSKNSYELGITATVLTESFYVTDLSGSNSLTIKEINTLYPHLASQYCHKQTSNSTILIDPNDPIIKATAISIAENTKDEKAFIIAKNLFIWLKQNLKYQIHPDNTSVQPARITWINRGGDCDDLTFLYISLCRAVGLPSRFIRGYIVEENRKKANAVAHAWAEVFVGGNIGINGWIPVECAGTAEEVETEINQNFGVEDANHLRLFIDDGSNLSIEASLSSVSVIRYNSKLNIKTNPFTEINNFTVLESKQLVVDNNGYRKYK